jgi:hypothetical protein
MPVPENEEGAATLNQEAAPQSQTSCPDNAMFSTKKVFLKLQNCAGFKEKIGRG